MIRDDFSASADDEGPTTSTSLANGDTTPKKGILKRPSVVSTESREKVISIPGFRPSPDRFPEKGATRIPKLQVTWWEKNAVAFIGETSDENNTDSEHLMRDLGNGKSGIETKALQIRQTAILDSEDSDMNENDANISKFQSFSLKSPHDYAMATKYETTDLDDAMSVASSTCSAASAVVGRWWTGKDTRYVPHCQKKGCKHAHHSNPSEYVTPLQRLNKELNQLKKDLGQANAEKDEKERHLIELRTKVQEFEMLNDTQNTLAEGQRQIRKEQIEREAMDREKKALEKKHAVRVNQLIQETMVAREESVKLTTRNAYLEEIFNTPKSDGETQTEDYGERDFLLRCNPPDPSDPSQMISQNYQTETSTPLSAMGNDQLISPGSPLMVSLISNDGKNQPLYCSQETVNHIQACQNEAFIWRNKAAQLEIIAKEQILKISQLEESLRFTQQPEPETHITVTQDALIVEDLSHKKSQAELQNEPILITDCNYEACIETKNLMKNEIEHLRQTFSDSKTRIGELEEDVNVLRRELEKADDDKMRLESSLASANEDIESKAAEIVASLNTANRLQHEKDKMHQAIDYMEERMQVYRNTIQDNDLVVSDENSAEWRRTVSDPRYLVMHSKLAQTTLTSQQLSEHESDFLSTQQTLHELKKEYSAKNTTLVDKFKEVEDILLTKTELVDALTKQLEEIRKDQTKEISQQQQERDQYKKSLEDVTLIAEKVPILEAQIAQLSREKNEIEAELKAHVESYEDELSQLLEDSLMKNKSQADYWAEKIQAHEVLVERLRSEIAGLHKNLDDQKINEKLHKAEMEKKLISSIEHVEKLQKGGNVPQRDVECQANPRQINKYVGCKPNVKSKETMVEKGALFDENEERLRICKAELETTRRQVTVLQQKLVSVIQQQSSQKIKKRIAVVEDNKTTAVDDSMDSKIREIELKNTELLERINTLESEKFVASSMEKTRIQKLVSEFDNLRQKLDLDMSNYSKEKQWLQWRISNLERDNSELQKTANLQNSVEKSSEHLGSTLRKTMSEPDFGDDMSTDGASTQDSTDFMVQSVTAPEISLQSHQPFSQLADVLNLVRSDLEQVLTEIEEPEVMKTETSQSQISLEQSTDILNNVLSEWAEDERKMLERQLRRSQEERTVLKDKNHRLSKELQVATAELHVYRLEKPHKEDQPKVLERSSSFSVFDNNNHEKDNHNWKEKAGTLFREVNRIRAHLAETLELNNELRYQLALARGERELSYCIEKDSQFPISPSLSFHTAPDANRKDDVIIHEPEEPFQLGSSKASLSCSIMIRSQSLERKSQAKEVERGRQRSRSANRKPPASKDELTKREKRRELRIPKNVSRSSSVTSLYMTSREQPKLPLMSASWHEKALENDLLECDTDYDRRNIRVVSLREKVGKLSRENKDLQNKLNYFANLPDSSRTLDLEKEIVELKTTVKELLQKVAHAGPNYEKQMKMLQDELDIRRRESSMYEKKLTEIEEERKEMYLVMFKKGQQAANMEMTEDKMIDAMTEDRITLKFLHDAFYYYLLNRGDSQEHLSVIMTILGFTNAQKTEVSSRKRGKSS